MATATATKTETNQQRSNPLEPEGWIKVQDNRPMYSVEQCDGMAIRGILLGTMMMNPSLENIRDGKKDPWTAVVIKLTAECKAVSSNDEVKMYPVGTEIIVGGMNLESLYRAADHPTKAFEVILKPSETLKLGGGRRLFQYDKMVNPNALERRKEGLMFFGRTQEAKQLPQQTSSQSPGDDDIPF